MTNVIKLLIRKNAELPLPEPDTRVATAGTSVLVQYDQLSLTFKGLSGHFDSIESAIDTIEDTEMRTRLRASIKLKREVMAKAILELSRQIGALVGRLGA